MMGEIVNLESRERRLRKLVLEHLGEAGFSILSDGTVVPPSLDKDTYRNFHLAQRQEKLAKNSAWLDARAPHLLPWFADGREVVPEAIAPKIELVRSETWQSELFRMAALLWRVPVSDGYGRRMRFLVWDESNCKLIGLIALGDPVFNQAARDSFIGWDHNRRKEALVGLMDAYVLGAVPPYNMLLGGKLVASLLSTREIQEEFHGRYSASVGVISGKRKRASLAAITTSSALGRSSVYNRLKLGGRTLLRPIGFTSGFGHFHISGAVFDELRRYLVDVGDAYGDGFGFGAGPNWRFRVIRKALVRLGLAPELVRHGFAREVFFCELADNATAYLRGDDATPEYVGLAGVRERSEAALRRWVVPRAARNPGFREWQSRDVLTQIRSAGLPNAESVRGFGT